MSRERLYLDHLELIEDVIRFTCRRHRASPDETEEFGGMARLALVEDDYAVLAAFEGRSKLGTYLSVVLQRLFLEFRVRKWGRWRPSAEAKRLGPLAVRLESLLVRDGRSLQEAYQVLASVDPELTREATADLAARLPPRVARRFENLEALEELPSREPSPDESVLDQEVSARKRQAGAALAEALTEMPSQDQLILRLRFVEGRQIVEIASVLRLEARPLYRRIERLATQLRHSLAERGFSSEDFGWPSLTRELPAGPAKRRSSTEKPDPTEKSVTGFV